MELPLPTLAVVIVFMSSFCSSDVTDVTLIRCRTGDVTRYQKDVGSVTDVTLICFSTGDVVTCYQKECWVCN